jgi:hypothetical protein
LARKIFDLKVFKGEGLNAFGPKTHLRSLEVLGSKKLAAYAFGPKLKARKTEPLNL